LAKFSQHWYKSVESGPLFRLDFREHGSCAKGLDLLSYTPAASQKVWYNPNFHRVGCLNVHYIDSELLVEKLFDTILQGARMPLVLFIIVAH
jgi:hypothetical protein